MQPAAPRLSTVRLSTFADLEQRLLRRPCTETLAEAYARSARRIRPRPMPSATQYRYPRGRSIDTIPLAAAFSPGPHATAALP